MNSTTARLHNRDEYCHASISDEMAKLVYDVLDADKRRFFLDMLVAGLDAFVATDYATWTAILRTENVMGADRMIADVRAEMSGSRLVRDYSGLHSLMSDMDVLDEFDFDWGLAVVKQMTSLPNRPPGPCPPLGQRRAALPARRRANRRRRSCPRCARGVCGAALQGQQLRGRRADRLGQGTRRPDLPADLPPPRHARDRALRVGRGGRAGR